MPALARVQANAEHAHRIDADAHWPFGKTGAVVEHEPLAPLLGVVRVSGAVAVVRLAEEVAQQQRRVSVVDKTGGIAALGHNQPKYAQRVLHHQQIPQAQIDRMSAGRSEAKVPSRSNRGPGVVVRRPIHATQSGIGVAKTTSFWLDNFPL
ncbi:hypothetical protein D3C81_1217350 [compost metagenome]